MNVNHAPLYSNISDLRKRPNHIIKSAGRQINAIFNHGNLVSYLVPPEILDELFEMNADRKTLSRVKNMDLSQAIDVKIDEL